KSSRQTRKRR
ncbi:unnamed protein product, partial [Oikopleura dioica]